MKTSDDPKCMMKVGVSYELAIHGLVIDQRYSSLRNLAMFKLTFLTKVIELLIMIAMSRIALSCSSSGSKGSMSILVKVCYEITFSQNKIEVGNNFSLYHNFSILQ